MSEFKLINFLEDAVLNGLRFDMKARLVASYTGKRKYVFLDPKALEKLGTDGLEIGSLTEIKVEPDGTLSYKGKRVVIYIRDVKQYKDDQSLPKYHLAFCSTLDTMRQHNRWHRYVVANRDDGTFIVNFVGDQTTSKPLRLAVCQNCLAHIGWEGYYYSMARDAKQNLVSQFTLARFFEKYPKDLLSVIPTHTVETAPLNDYPEDWGMISETLKSKRGYKCEKCGHELKGALRKYLHVHHKNGNKADSGRENLEVLCIRCHAEAPMHSHMRSSRDYSEFINLGILPSQP